MHWTVVLLCDCIAIVELHEFPQCAGEKCVKVCALLFTEERWEARCMFGGAVGHAERRRGADDIGLGQRRSGWRAGGQRGAPCGVRCTRVRFG